MQEKKNWNYTLTYLKALGFSIVVLVHGCMLYMPMAKFDDMYVMPLFFISSGFVLKQKYIDDGKTFLIKRIKGLYKPYVKWGLIFLLVPNLIWHLHLTDSQIFYQIFRYTICSWQDMLTSAGLIIGQMRTCDNLLGGYWFLNALFFGSILSWLFLHFIKKPEMALAASVIVMAIVNITNFHVIFLNLNQQTFLVAVFVIIGYIMAQRKVKPFGYPLIAVSFIITYIGSLYWSVHFNDTEYDSIKLLPATLTAVLATWAWYSLFDKWKETTSIFSRTVRYIGDNTLTILTWHILSFKIVSIIIILIYDLPISHLGDLPAITGYAVKGWWVAYFISGIAVPCFIAYCRDKIKELRAKRLEVRG